MAKKFNAVFIGSENLMPVVIYISPSESYSGYYNESIKYRNSSVESTFSSKNDIGDFYLKNELKLTESEAQAWAIDELKICLNKSVELIEIFD